jgi:hypothetical protein
MILLLCLLLGPGEHYRAKTEVRRGYGHAGGETAAAPDLLASLGHALQDEVAMHLQRIAALDRIAALTDRDGVRLRCEVLERRELRRHRQRSQALSRLTRHGHRIDAPRPALGDKAREATSYKAALEHAAKEIQVETIADALDRLEDEIGATDADP